ncbi:Lacal_2735 family protein [Robiginitalea sp. SC105]|uniref:Lacal_2735 family protein n=1 Tax=Robiginitalea sp. SC105 TaxID=2762332 RepID=UPI00163B3A4B|nr:Lacal_2735 family protein [Robiginitalea sp. SC105]MBC2839007.1 Lacal_2735 family protein [Robiginitalea sp. SC105]
MFGMFKSRSPRQKLEDKYKKLMAEAHALSQTNRSQGDAKYAAAEEVMKQIESLESNR